MYKKFTLLVLVFTSVSTFSLVFLASPLIQDAMAHPGNTADDGGHYCWTRCGYWGEVYGERHFHGGGGYVEPDPPEPDYTEYEPDAENYYSSNPDTSNTDSASEDIQSSESGDESQGTGWGWLIGLGIFYGGIGAMGGIGVAWERWGDDIKKWWKS